MTLRSYIGGMFISTLLSLGAWVLIIFYIDPTVSGPLGFVLFYLSLFLGLVGLFSLVGFYLRRKISKKEIAFAHVSPSFRQGIFLAVILVGCLLLQSFRVLNWWSGGLFIASIILLEFYFISR